MSTVPTEIRQGGADTLVIRWADGAEHALDVFGLRCACPCASCVDEMTGVRRLESGDVDPDVRPRRVVTVGNYALKIDWSDGHDTGIYSYELLRRLGERARS